MTADLLIGLLNVNLALAVAVAIVVVARLPVRRLFGARIAYKLWSLPPLAILAMLVPARVVTITAPAGPVAGMVGEAPSETGAPIAPILDLGALALGLWLAGVVASLAWLAWRQGQFARAAKAGCAGPALVGVLRPRVVVPSDFTDRYTPRECELVLAHEQAHVQRRDPPVNALLALLTCVNWFNPAVHVMSRWLRIDQELACDARVVAAFPKARKAYAEAMLKTQLAARPLPLGCHWAAHPLAHRVRLLSSPAPSRGRRLTGLAFTLLLSVGAASAVWAARPPEVVLVAPDAPIIEVLQHQAAPSAPVKPSPPPRARAKPEIVARAPTLERADAEASPVRAEPALMLLPPPLPFPPPPPPPPELSRPRIIHAVADRSLVQPGSAVRVVASGLAPDGAPLWADFTAFGSQRSYRKGAYERGGSRYSLFTSVIQKGDCLRVAVSLGRAFRPEMTGSIDLVPGHTGVVRLPSGQDIVVTASVRAETQEEIEEGRRVLAYGDMFDAFRPERAPRPERG